MDQIEDVCAEMQTIKGETAIIVKLRDGFKEPKICLTNSVSENVLKYKTEKKKLSVCLSCSF